MSVFRGYNLGDLICSSWACKHQHKCKLHETVIRYPQYQKVTPIIHVDVDNAEIFCKTFKEK